MYLIQVESTGKYSNVATGPRVAFFKKDATNFCQLLDENECKYTLYCLKRLHGLFFGYDVIYITP